MKYTITTLAAVSIAFLSSCGDKPTEHSDNDGHQHDSHTSDHSRHDHSSKQDKKGEHVGHGHADHSGHDHIKAGPNKGRMISGVTPQAEFFVMNDGRVKISFFDADMKAVAPAGETVSVITGERISPLELSFEAEGYALLSKEVLPKGNYFPTVVAIKTGADSEEVVSKFTLNLSDCSSCDNKEYSCECHH
ncbi:MAG: hypothetical protein ABGY95_06675 [Rubritalea sp.]|uniref:hypothetical protein n=1 Tax=Rubritalea sp. TaxID=2109375 RepID=UPI003242C2EF